MSSHYQAVNWNRQKIVYDGVLIGSIVTFLATFLGVGAALHPDATAETLLIRGLGTLAITLLTIVLAIGPLARLDARFLPLLYNRRHLGVATFVIALAHGVFSIIQFHALGDLNVVVSVLTGDGSFSPPREMPFQLFGLAALAVLFLLAATSHDFWLANLSPQTWKTLHMLVYVAYALLVAHVALGALQGEPTPLPALLLATSAATLLALHLLADWRGTPASVGGPPLDDGFVDVCDVHDIKEGRAKVATLGGERVAIFRHDGKLSCVSNVCRHQMGPLGEGRIVDGCITCPWHGYQYHPESGTSPPPFTEKVETFDVRLAGNRVLVHPRPHAPGTRVEPAVVPEPFR